MRVNVAVVALTLCLVGCASTHPTGPSPATATWRVVPLSTNTFPERCAILVNEQTGDTWIYSSDQWNELKRQ